MKKNKMMRAASALLVAVLLTTCAVSGTFAKYVTSDDASDSARVAKFGVVVTADGTLFGKTYLNATTNTPGADDATPDTITVKSSEKVVAPGTKNDTGFTFAITGQPEVDVKLTVDVTAGYKDVYLKGTTDKYPDMTTGKDVAFEHTSDYYPIKYTLWQKKSGDSDYSVYKTGASDDTKVENKTLAELVTALEALDVANVPANTDLGATYGTYKITWTWDYGTTGAPTSIDKADTLLGDLAAGLTTKISDKATATSSINPTVDTHYNLGTNVEIKVTVEQID